MDQQEKSQIVQNVREILLNKPLSSNEELINEEYKEVKAALDYLSTCVIELNSFLKDVSQGKLNSSIPDRKNVLAGDVKELHASLKHLTWQASRVAEGDYNQSVSFLGEFSDSFNQMISQLKEREEKLKRQSNALKQNNLLLKDIMDGIQDWIIVTEKDNDRVIYINNAAENALYKSKISSSCNELEDILKNKKHLNEQSNEHAINVVMCDSIKKTYRIETFLVEWNDKDAYVNRIVDITKETIEHAKIEAYAYKDELTGLHNRRYFTNELAVYLDKRLQFSLCFIDLDNLKYTNDEFGHTIGDDYLKLVAKTINLERRTSDIVARIGGDEFVVVFFNCNREKALNKLISINEQLHKQSKEFEMSISYGVIEVNTNNECDLETILNQADALMYERKRKKKKNRF